MSQTNTILLQIANEVVCKEKIISYLDLLKNNINMSAINCSMIYLQNPNAKMVCGRKAWTEMGRNVNEGAKPIVLLFPSVTIKEPPEEFCIDGVPMAVGDTDVPIYLKEAVYESNYIPVNGFDYDSTTGEDVSSIVNKPNFIDNIIEVSGGTTQSIFSKALEGYKGKYEPNENIFYLSDDIDISTEYGRNEYDKTLISLFIDYKMSSYNIPNKEVKKALEYVLYERYGFTNHNIEKPLFAKLNKYTGEQKVDFLLTIHYLVSDIIQDFEGYYLNFDETALINDLLISSEYDDMWIAFNKAMTCIDDEILVDNMKTLQSKLMLTANGYLDDILAQKMAKCLYSYPPAKVILDRVDYLRKERRKLLEETMNYDFDSINVDTKEGDS